jgi:methyl-accepting chemotaxis protein
VTDNAQETHSELLHIRETITMLYLAVCQIETSVNESNSSIDDLTTSFTDLAHHSQEVDEHVQAMTDLSELTDIKRQVNETSMEMQSKIKQAITAFQFYDRISQRLDHVARSLERVSDVIGDSDRVNDPETWTAIQEQVKSSYSMESERIMFEHIMRGASVKEALEIYRHHFSQEETGEVDGDEIELF